MKAGFRGINVTLLGGRHRGGGSSTYEGDDLAIHLHHRTHVRATATTSISAVNHQWLRTQSYSYLPSSEAVAHKLLNGQRVNGGA
jgi:hypothetical protein